MDIDMDMDMDIGLFGYYFGICICIFMCMMFDLIDRFSYYYHKYPRPPRIYNNNCKKNG